MAHSEIEILRVYDDPGRRGGDFRVLVDRQWPRGIDKAQIDVDEWAKDLTLSAELRTWYGHKPEHFKEFSRSYRAELKRVAGKAAVAQFLTTAGSCTFIRCSILSLNKFSEGRAYEGKSVDHRRWRPT